MKIQLQLDTSRLKKQGYPLIIYIYVSKMDRKYPYTGYYSDKVDWDFDKQEPKASHPLYFAIMDFILDMRRKIIGIQNERNINLTAEQIQNRLLAKSTGFYSFWEQRIAEVTNPGLKTAYQNTLNEFQKYRSYVEFKDIDYTFLQGFKLLKKKTCSANGINTYLKNIRAVYNEGIRRGLYQPTSYISPFNKIMEKAEPTQDKYFTIDEIKKIVEKEEKSTYDYYFLLCFYLGGLDFIDIAMMKKSDIKKGRIRFVRHKGNTNEIIDNKIFPEAQEILDHFANDSEYLTNIHTYKSIKNVRENYTNRYRKQLEQIGVNSYFTSKTPRYSFIYIGNKELQLNRDIMKEIVAHAKNDTHSIYEGSFSYSAKDEVHRKVIDSILVTK